MFLLKKQKQKQKTKFRLRKKYEIETKMNWQKQQLNNTALEEVKQRDILMALDRNDVILLSFKIKLFKTQKYNSIHGSNFLGNWEFSHNLY